MKEFQIGFGNESSQRRLLKNSRTMRKMRLWRKTSLRWHTNFIRRLSTRQINYVWSEHYFMKSQKSTDWKFNKLDERTAWFGRILNMQMNGTSWAFESCARFRDRISREFNNQGTRQQLNVRSAWNLLM